MTAPQFGVGEWKTRDGRKAVVQGVGGPDSEPYTLEGHIEGKPTCWCSDGAWVEAAGTTLNDLIGPWGETPSPKAPAPMLARGKPRLMAALANWLRQVRILNLGEGGTFENASHIVPLPEHTEVRKTLLDEFAMAALQGQLASESKQFDQTNPSFSSFQDLAESSYLLADAMLAARGKARSS
ncbi:hypothetical protein J8F10_08665 [Gemmata sp. G18]|uniref:Uncharacterized protein n=1 Tax=Gemmata palustris TaxID=2822762 RepID=A0ABS5BNV9_9BACT|nr:hypothetical protein [Gemmata palustris]MBP3955350.1 hypothetical protein [Gemmata palustris]